MLTRRTALLGALAAPAIIRPAKANLQVNTLTGFSAKGGALPPQGNLYLWVKANAGVLLDGSNNVQRWDDLSGNGRNFSQSTSSARPAFISGGGNRGQPCLRFDGTDDVLISTSFTLTQPYHAFIVFKALGFASGEEIVTHGTSATTNNLWQQVGSSPDIRTNDSGGAVTLSPALALNTWGILQAVKNGTRSGIALNANARNTANITGQITNGLYIGGFFAAPANMDVTEFLIYSAEQFDRNLVSVLDYLNGEHGVY